MTDIEQRLAAAGLRVKPLELRKFNDRCYDAKSGDRRYQIRPGDGRVWCDCWCVNLIGHYSEKIAEHIREPEAIAALQAHNAAAILSSLEVIE